MTPILLTIRVKPKAREPSITETADGGFIVAVREAPTGGQANAAVLKAVARFFRIPQSSITIVRGFASRNKMVRIEGLGNRE